MRQNTFRAAAMSLGLLIAGCAAFRSTSPSTIVPSDRPAGATIRITMGAPNAAIPADFVGLSIEMRRILANPYVDETGNGATRPTTAPVPPRLIAAENVPLVALFRTMGIRSLRVGGNTVDRETIPLPTMADIDALFAFAKAADVQVIYALRLNGAQPTDAATTGKYIADRYASQLACFEIGNEPDSYFTTYEAFATRFELFRAAITSAVPGATFCGPCTTQGHAGWAARFASDHAGARGGVRLITQHAYPCSDGKKATDANAAIETLLSPARLAGYQKIYDAFVPTVCAAHLQFRLEETNNFYSGGAPNASNTFVAALWALDYLHWWAAHGAAGMNFHTSDFFPFTMDGKPTWYGAFARRADGTGYDPKPLAYALAAFSATRPARSISVSIETQNDVSDGASGPAPHATPPTAPSPTAPSNVTLYATESSDGRVFLTVINKAHGQGAQPVHVVLPRGRRATACLALRAPSIDAIDAITLGGAAIPSNGSAPIAFAAIAASATLDVGAGSAMICLIDQVP